MTKHNPSQNDDFAHAMQMLREARPEQIWRLLKDIQSSNSGTDGGARA